MYHIFFIHSSVDGHLGCFHVLAIVNSDAMNVCVHVFVCVPVFSPSGYVIPRSDIDGSYGTFLISFLRKSQTVFHNSCIILHHYQQLYKGSSFSTSSPTFIFHFSENSHCRGCEVVPHCGFDLGFPND